MKRAIDPTPKTGLEKLDSQLLEALFEADGNETAAGLIHAQTICAKRGVVDTAQRLQEAIESIRRHLGYLEAELARCETWDKIPCANSLGEVQGRGLEVDRLCALLYEQKNQVERLEFVQRSLAKLNGVQS